MKFKNMKRKRFIVIGIVTLGLILLGAVAFGIFDKDALEEEPPQPSYSQLTGVEVESEVAERPILGVMIENSEAARPQTGLDNAGIVFEAVTEGGITRFLALYQENPPDTVGPVRSLRVNFLDWAMGFDASIAHVGGSPEALTLADERDAKSLNEFQYSEPYYRDDERDAPHNMFARTEDLRKLQGQQNHEKSRFADIPRSGDSPSQAPEASKVTIDFSSPPYVVEFRYDPATNSYTRYLAGKPHIDAVSKEPIAVKNVVVIKLPTQRTTQDGALGDGKALVFKDGNVISARWEKANFEERIKIVDSENNEVALNRGKTWIPAVPSDKPVTY